MNPKLLLALALLALSGCSRSLTEAEYTTGPFPSQLPAGWGMVSDGKSFTFVLPITRQICTELAGDTACEAVQNAWHYLEYSKALDRRLAQPKQPVHWLSVPTPKSGDWCEPKK